MKSKYKNELHTTCLLLLAGLNSAFGAQRPPECNLVDLTVIVENRTPDGSTVSPDKIMLEIYKDAKKVDSISKMVGDTGKVKFENLKAEHNLFAVPAVLHHGMRFTGRSVELNPDGKNISTDVAVYDITYQNSSLYAQTHHILIELKEHSLVLTEYIQLINPLEMAVSSREMPDVNRPKVLEISLPEGYKRFRSLSYFEPKALVFSEKGFYDTMAVPPGSFRVTFSYMLDIDSDNREIKKRITLPTSGFVVFSRLGRAEINGLGRPDGRMGLSSPAAGTYYQIGKCEAGKELDFIITGLKAGLGTKANWIIPALVFAGIAVFVILKARRA